MCILLLYPCFSAKVEKKKGLGGMMSINHGVFAGLCTTTQTAEQAEILKHCQGKNNNTMTKHNLLSHCGVVFPD